MKSLVTVLSVFYIGIIQLSELPTSKSPDMYEKETTSISTEEQKRTLAVRRLLPCLGFRGMKANITFLQFLQYFGDDKARDADGYTLSDDFFQSILRDDPYYRNFYVFMTGSVSLRAAMPEKSVELINLGLESLTDGYPEDSFYIWRYKAVDELLFLGDVEAARLSFEMAANLAKQSSLPESDLIATTSQQTADFLKQNPDSKSAQIECMEQCFDRQP